MDRIGGVDGCPIGWLRLEASLLGQTVTPAVFTSAKELIDGSSQFSVLTIDIPIGLPTVGPRACDIMARRFIQPRGSSVFPAPVRSVLDAESYVHACELSQAACGKSLSKQTFAILPKDPGSGRDDPQSGWPESRTHS